MTYSIVKVIHGTYLPADDDIRDEVCRLMDEHTGEDWGEGWMDDESIFTYEYHGNASHAPIWVGVGLDTFDEAQDAMNINKLTLTPTEEQLAVASERLERLPQAVRNMLPPVGVYFVFCSS